MFLAIEEGEGGAYDSATLPFATLYKRITVDKAIMHRAIMHKSHNALVLGVDGVGSYLNQPLLNIEY